MTVTGLSCDQCRLSKNKTKCDHTRSAYDYENWKACAACVKRALKTGDKPEDVCTNVLAVPKAIAHIEKAEEEGEKNLAKCAKALLAFYKKSRQDAQNIAIARDPITV